MLGKTHDFVVKEALKLVNSRLFKKHRKKIREYTVSADWPGYKLWNMEVSLSSLYHFYNPKTGRGFLWFKNAKEYGTERFKLAVELYKKKQVDKSLRVLGQALHALADMSVPAHTKNSIHYFDTDCLENYTFKNLKKFRFTNLRAKTKRQLTHFYEDLARISSRFRVIERNFFTSLLQVLGFGKKLHRHTLKKQSRILTREAIMYTAGLLKEFEKRIKKKVLRPRKVHTL